MNNSSKQIRSYIERELSGRQKEVVSTYQEFKKTSGKKALIPIVVFVVLLISAIPMSFLSEYLASLGDSGRIIFFIYVSSLFLSFLLSIFGTIYFLIKNIMVALLKRR